MQWVGSQRLETLKYIIEYVKDADGNSVINEKGDRVCVPPPPLPAGSCTIYLGKDGSIVSPPVDHETAPVEVYGRIKLSFQSHPFSMIIENSENTLTGKAEHHGIGSYVVHGNRSATSACGWLTMTEIALGKHDAEFTLALRNTYIDKDPRTGTLINEMSEHHLVNFALEGIGGKHLAIVYLNQVHNGATLLYNPDIKLYPENIVIVALSSGHWDWYSFPSVFSQENSPFSATLSVSISPAIPIPSATSVSSLGTSQHPSTSSKDIIRINVLEKARVAAAEATRVAEAARAAAEVARIAEVARAAEVARVVAEVARAAEAARVAAEAARVTAEVARATEVARAAEGARGADADSVIANSVITTQTETQLPTGAKIRQITTVQTIVTAADATEANTVLEDETARVLTKALADIDAKIAELRRQHHEAYQKRDSRRLRSIDSDLFVLQQQRQSIK